MARRPIPDPPVTEWEPMHNDTTLTPDERRQFNALVESLLAVRLTRAATDLRVPVELRTDMTKLPGEIYSSIFSALSTEIEELEELLQRADRARCELDYAEKALSERRMGR